MFIIFAFNETLIEAAVSHIHRIPWVGQKLEAPFKEFLVKQKEKLHRKSETAVDQVTIQSIVSLIYDYVEKYTVTYMSRYPNKNILPYYFSESRNSWLGL